MTKKNQTDIKKALKSYSEAFQKDGPPIPVNFRTLVPELKKAERFTHLIHSYPAKLLTNIPYFFLATDILCPKNGIVLDPFCGTGTVLLEAVLSGRNAWGADSNPLATGGTFVSDMPGTFESDTGGTFIPLLSNKPDSLGGIFMHAKL